MRLPPYDKEAELGVLGSLLLDAEKVHGLCADNKVTSSSFYVPAHRYLFGQIVEMIDNKQPVDLLTTEASLKNNGRLKAAGGYEFLEMLIDKTPTAAHAEYYIGFVKQKHLLRRIIEESTNTVDRCYAEGDQSAESIIGMAESSLFDLSGGCVSDEVNLYDIGESFIRRCELGLSGHVPHFCAEWTEELGSLSNEIVFVHAPRSTGKTSFVIQWHRYAESCGVKGALFSLESTKDAIYPRYLAQEGRVNTFAMRNRLSSNHPFWEKARKANRSLHDMRLVIEDGSWTIERIRSKARQLVRAGTEYIMIDNLVCIKTEKDFQRQQAKYMYLMEQIRDMRNEIDKPIIILAHPNVEGNIKHAGELEDMADVVIYLKDVVREETRRGGDPVEALSKIGLYVRMLDEMEAQIIAKFQKNREGPTPLLELIFNKSIQTFMPIVERKDGGREEDGLL